MLAPYFLHTEQPATKAMQESSCWAQAAGPAQVGTAGTAASPTAPVQCDWDILNNSLGAKHLEWSQLLAHFIPSPVPLAPWRGWAHKHRTSRMSGHTLLCPRTAPERALAAIRQRRRKWAPVDVGAGESQLGWSTGFPREQTGPIGEGVHANTSLQKEKNNQKRRVDQF